MNKVYYRHVIERFLTEKQVKEFDENYKEHRNHYPTRKPKDWEIKMAKEYSKGISMAKLRHDYGIKSTTAFYTSISRVYKHQE